MNDDFVSCDKLKYWKKNLADFNVNKTNKMKKQLKLFIKKIKQIIIIFKKINLIFIIC